MKKLAIPFVSAVLGGGVTAAALIGAGVVDGETKTVYQQAPLSQQTRAVSEPAAQEGLTARDIYKRDAPGVVFVRARSLRQSESPFDLFGGEGRESAEATGSGFVIDRDGHILTNAHVVNGATSVAVTFSDKRTLDAKIVGKDESTDLALLKVDPKAAKLTPLELGDSNTVEVGDPTVAIGNPFGFDRTLTTGVVSALQRRIQAPNQYSIEDVIQTDAAINPGNSGGPLIDAGGRVIGINSQIATGAGGSGSVGIGFAVPVNTAKKVVKQLIEHGRVQRAWLGLEFIPIGEGLSALGLQAKSGLLVQQIVSGGPADRAGLRGGDQLVTLSSGERVLLGGDVITAIDGTAMKVSEDIAKLLERRKPGDKVKLTVRRGDSERTLEVQLGDRPAGKVAR